MLVGHVDDGEARMYGGSKHMGKLCPIPSILLWTYNYSKKLSLTEEKSTAASTKNKLIAMHASKANKQCIAINEMKSLYCPGIFTWNKFQKVLFK